MRMLAAIVVGSSIASSLSIACPRFYGFNSNAFWIRFIATVSVASFMAFVDFHAMIFPAKCGRALCCRYTNNIISIGANPMLSRFSYDTRMWIVNVRLCNNYDYIICWNPTTAPFPCDVLSVVFLIPRKIRYAIGVVSVICTFTQSIQRNECALCDTATHIGHYYYCYYYHRALRTIKQATSKRAAQN